MGNSVKISDILLVEALKRGSMRAFNIIYQRYAKRLLIYVGRTTRNQEDAEEIVHDIFINLWSNRTSLDTRYNLSSLLFSIAYKRKIDFYHQSMRTPVLEDYLSVQDELATTDAAPLEYEDFMNIFTRALNRIPEQQRKYIVLSRIEELSNKEIAERLNVSDKTVRNELSAGIKMLRRELSNIIETDI